MSPVRPRRPARVSAAAILGAIWTAVRAGGRAMRLAHEMAGTLPVHK